MLDFRKFYTLLFISLFYSAVVAQVKTVGTPFVRNYSRSDYQAGNQNWDIQQASNGMMYFANNEGLLEFDGTHWNIYTLPNNSIVRSIKNGVDGIMYAGGFNEIGYYNIGLDGGAVYNSITDLVPDELKDFGEVWNIFVNPDGIIFQTYSQIMFYKNDTINVIMAPSLFHFSFMINNEYYINDMEQGLMRYAMGHIYPLKGVDKLKGKEIWGILPYEKKLLISTASDGTYLYDGNSLILQNTPSSTFLRKNQIYSSLRLKNNDLAFGTIQDGLLICDLSGTPIHHINIEDGIQNNTILCLEEDNLGNLWVGTDHGIDYVEINSPLLRISNNYGISTGYTLNISQDNLYFGTNQGLFYKSLSQGNKLETEDKKLKIIEEIRGQVWSLDEIRGDLFCGHNNGTFIIDGVSAQKISEAPGGWTHMEVPNDSLKVIGGTYTGLVLYEKISGKWKFRKEYEGFPQSSRSMAFDKDNTLWITHGYKGVYHIFFDESYDSIIKVDLYDSQNSQLPFEIFGLSYVDDRIIFLSGSGVLVYSAKDNDFVLDEFFKKHLENHQIRSVKRDNEGNIWYFEANSVGVLRKAEDGQYSNITLPFKDLHGQFVNGFEFVYPYDEENVFFGTEYGFEHYRPKINKNYNYQFTSYLNSMQTFDPDSVFHINGSSEEASISLDYSNNSVEFIFSANDFENPDQILFSTFLDGYDKNWSTWQNRNSREYTNLDEGKFTFKVKAKNIYGTITETKSIEFSILPPFQRSLPAYFLYFLVFLLIIYFNVLALKRRFIRAKRRNQKDQEELFLKKEEKLQRERLEAEKEIIRMRNDKLREGIKLKDKELANSTIEMLHKNEVLIALRVELKKLADCSNDESHKHEVNHLVSKINKEIDNEKQWKVFETHFESVHEEFLKRIKAANQNLTPRELKLCAYLRMNISSKEISVLMNISTRGVEISRYRLRKKLELTRETNLTDFILSF